MKIGIFGSSGFAREVVDICESLGFSEIVFVDNLTKEKVVEGIQVYPWSKIKDLKRNGYVFAIGIGDPLLRREIAREHAGLEFPNLLHKTVTLGRNQKERLQDVKGAIFCAGVRLTNGIEIGDFCVININSVVGHDCVIGDFVSIMSGCFISGNVIIGEAAYIGTGATIIQGSIAKKMLIGSEALVGIGSVVMRRVKAGQKVFGNPAQKIS